MSHGKQVKVVLGFSHLPAVLQEGLLCIRFRFKHLPEGIGQAVKILWLGQETCIVLKNNNYIEIVLVSCTLHRTTIRQTVSGAVT